jgi:hypothetical protein
MNMTHTPGPWRCNDFGEIFADPFYSKKVAEVPVVSKHAPFAHGEEMANASIIAAAPDLLAALIQMNQLFVKVDLTETEAEVCRMALAAIAKAEGRV